MRLRQKRRYERPGVPEFLAVLMLAGILAPSVGLLNSLMAPRFETAPGRVVSCDVQLTHYNATNALPKVFMTYTYGVGVSQYTCTWQGFWPNMEGPNALPPDKLDQLKQPGYGLIVFYDPANPEISQLHPSAGFTLFYALALAGSVVVSGFYFVWVYPQWKRMRG